MKLAKIQIINCQHDTYWYANKIGEMYEAKLLPGTKEVESQWAVLKGQVTVNGSYYIDLEDAVIVYPQIRKVRKVRCL